MSERMKDFTCRDMEGNRRAVAINARYVAAVEDSLDGGAVISVYGTDAVFYVTQSRAEVCAWLQNLPPS